MEKGLKLPGQIKAIWWKHAPNKPWSLHLFSHKSMIIRETKRGTVKRTYHIETTKHPTHIPYRGTHVPQIMTHRLGFGPHDPCAFFRKQMGWKWALPSRRNASGWQWLAAMTVVLVDSIFILSSWPQKQLPSVNKIEPRTKLGHPAAESAAIKMGRTGRGTRRWVKLVVRAGVVVVSFRMVLVSQ